MKIYLDDDLVSPNRKTPEGWTRALNVQEFYELIDKALTMGEKIESISFDNDLGEPRLENEGRSALKRLMNTYPELLKEGLKVSIHTDNNEARDAMRKDLQYWREHIDELIEAKDRPDPWAELDKIK